MRGCDAVVWRRWKRAAGIHVSGFFRRGGYAFSQEIAEISADTPFSLG